MKDKEKKAKKNTIKNTLGLEAIIADYMEYYRERDRITAKRKAGQHTNLTNNPWLRDYVFLYNNRDDDKGSKLFYTAIKDRSEYEKLLLSSIYRFSSSSKLVLAVIQAGGTIEEIIQKISQMPKLIDGGFIYQFTFPLKKDGGVKTYITEKLPSLVSSFMKTWNVYNKEVLIDATRDLAAVFSIRKKVNNGSFKDVTNPFVAHQVLADMTYFYPEKIDKESLCYMGKGAYEAMKLMSIPASNYLDKKPKTMEKIQAIKDKLGCSWLEWEHSACEFNKLFEIKNGLKEGRKFKPHTIV